MNLPDTDPHTNLGQAIADRAEVSVLNVSHLQFSHQWNQIINDLSFSLNPGQCLYIQGKNGAGKTTLLKLISGLIKPDSGSIEFNGSDIKSQLRSYARQILFLGHKLSIYPELTILENIQYFLTLVNEKTELNEILDVLNILDLKYFVDVHAKHLSAGQQRKVALSRLWLTSRPLWILDEPFYALDQQSIELINDKIIAHIEQDNVVILSAHHGLNTDHPGIQTIRL